MHHNNENVFSENSDEEIFILPCQKIFLMSENTKDFINGFLSETIFTLENFDQLDIDFFQLKEKEKIVKYLIKLFYRVQNEKEFLIVEKSEIKYLTQVKEEVENFSDHKINSDINDITCMKKRKREESKRIKNKKKIRNNNLDFKLNKNYRNGDLEGENYFNFKKNNHNHKNKERCDGCCFCIKKKKLKKNGAEENKNSNEENCLGINSLKSELEKIQEEINYPKLENPFELLNSETINKKDFNLFFDHLTIYFSNLTSVISQKFRQLDEKKSNKKKFVNTEKTERKSRKKKKLTEHDKVEIAKKIHELNIKQLNDMVEIFPDYMSKKDDAITFKFNDLPDKILWQLKEFVEKCYDDNLMNPIHQNYEKEIQLRNQIRQQSNQNLTGSNGDVFMSNAIGNNMRNNLMKIRNNLLSDKDDDISESLSSSSSSSIDSISELDRRIKKNLGNPNQCFSPDYFSKGNIVNNGIMGGIDYDMSDSGYNKCDSESS